MTRSERQTLLATFLFGVVGMVGIGVLGMRYVEHPRPLPPLDLPYFTPPPLPPRYEAPPVPVASAAPRRTARVRKPPAAPPHTTIEIGDDPLIGLHGL